MKKYNIIDLFSGCGGLLDGFMQTGKYNPVASVEWELKPTQTLAKRLKEKWNISDADESVMRFDIQRVDELFNGYDDVKYDYSELFKRNNKTEDLGQITEKEQTSLVVYEEGFFTKMINKIKSFFRR